MKRRMKHTRPTSRGFTLLEMMIVVAIIAVVASIIFGTVTARKEVLNLEREARSLRSRISKTRARAAVAGSRLGTNRFVGCNGPGDTEIAVAFAAGQYTFPTSLDYDAATDVMTAACDTHIFVNTAEGRIDMIGLNNTGRIAFSSIGRVINPVAATPQQLYFELQHNSGNNHQERRSFRLLPSGVIYSSSTPAEHRCDEDEDFL